MEDRFPPVPDELLQVLNTLFPERSPEIGETDRDLVWRGGQRSVIRFLNEKYRLQNETVTAQVIR
jgi:hypothetical protein